MKATLLIGWIVCVAGCASTQDPSTTPSTSSGRPMAAAPSTRRMTRAFNRVRESVEKCLRPGDDVLVAGTFEGPTGEFKVERISSSNSQTLQYAVETCVRVAAEQAEVTPFLNEHASFEGHFALAGTTPNPTTNTTSPTVNTTQRPVTNSSIVTGSVTVGPRETPAERLRREANAFNTCYDHALARDHTTEGTIELHIVVNRSGHAQRVETRVLSVNNDVTLLQLVARCIESHVNLLDFGEQGVASTDVTIPLNFAPMGSASMPIE